VVVIGSPFDMNVTFGSSDLTFAANSVAAAARIARVTFVARRMLDMFGLLSVRAKT
jgi:hypothetical protein